MPDDPRNSPAPAGESNASRVVDALYRVNNFMAHVGDLHQLLERIMEESKAVVDADASSCLLYDKASDELFFEVALGDKAAGVKEIRLPMGTGIAGQCALERRTLAIGDVSKDSRHFKGADEKSEYQTRNLLAAPMVRSGRLIGVLEVLNKKNGGDFTSEDIGIMEFFAGQAAIAIENALLVQENVRAERLAALGQAVAGISHYIKNVLSGIKGSASLIDHAFKTGDMNMAQKAWPVLERSSRKITSLVQDMLAYSKDREPDLEPGNLNDVAKDTIDTCRDSARDAGVELTGDLDAKMPETLFDVTRIGDAVLNLVGNAIEASAGRPGARVALKTVYDPDGAVTRLIVSDNGPGIPKEIQTRIFEPFFSTKGSKGTGLGLAIARKVIQEHGGGIDLRSAFGEGATFTIRLPARLPE